MRLQAVKPGDVVEADVRGQSFFGRVLQVNDRVEVESLNGRALGYQFLTSRQVVGVYSKRKGSR